MKKEQLIAQRWSKENSPTVKKTIKKGETITLARGFRKTKT